MISFRNGVLEIWDKRVGNYTLSNKCVNNLLRVVNGEIECSHIHNLCELCEEIKCSKSYKEYTNIGEVQPTGQSDKCTLFVRTYEKSGEFVLFAKVVRRGDGVVLTEGYQCSKGGESEFRRKWRARISETFELPDYSLEERLCQQYG